MTEKARAHLSQLKKGKRGHAHTEESRRKISASHMGSKNPFWRGGVSEQNHRLRNSVEYKLWRGKVFKRDNYTCQECGARGGRIEADHLKSWKHHPEFRFDVSNGKTLCKKCHEQTPNYGWRGR